MVSDACTGPPVGGDRRGGALCGQTPPPRPPQPTHPQSSPPPHDPAVDLDALKHIASPARRAGGARVPAADTGGGEHAAPRGAAGSPSSSAGALLAGGSSFTPPAHGGAAHALAAAHTAEVWAAHSGGDRGGAAEKGSSRPAGVNVGLAQKQMDSRRAKYGTLQGRKGG